MNKLNCAVNNLTRAVSLRRLSATVPVLVFLLLASMAGAQDSPARILSIPVSLTTPVSPCPGESLQISGRIFIRVETSTSPNGTKQLKTSTNLQPLTGQGETSHIAYRFKNEGPEQKNLLCPPGQKCRSILADGFKLNGNGPNQDLSGFMITRIDEQANGDLTAKLERFDFVCPAQN